MDPRPVSVQMAALTEKLRRRLDKLAQGLFLEADRRIVMRTPVRTGRARGNWMLSEGAPAGTTRETLDPTGAAAIAEGVAYARGIRIGGTYFIVNSLPYIYALEHGSSKQAPQGMARLTADEIQVLADSLIQQIKASEV